jgi:hypothetical protein
LALLLLKLLRPQLFKLLRPQYLLVPGWDPRERGCFAGRLRLTLRSRRWARQGHRGSRLGQDGGLSRLPGQQSLRRLNRARLLKLVGCRLGLTSGLQRGLRRQRMCGRLTGKHVPGWDPRERGSFGGRLRLPLRRREGTRQGRRSGRPGRRGGLSRLTGQQSQAWLNRARLLKLSGCRLGLTSRLQRGRLTRQRLRGRLTRKHVAGQPGLASRRDDACAIGGWAGVRRGAVSGRSCRRPASRPVRLLRACCDGWRQSDPQQRRGRKRRSASDKRTRARVRRGIVRCGR